MDHNLCGWLGIVNQQKNDGTNLFHETGCLRMGFP